MSLPVKYTAGYSLTLPTNAYTSELAAFPTISHGELSKAPNQPGR